MMHRWFSLALIAIALGLSSCNTAEPKATDNDPATQSVAAPNPADPQGTEATSPTDTNEDIANVAIAPKVQPNSNDSPQSSAGTSPEEPAPSPASESPSTSPEAAATAEQATETASITIDETVCGAGGQEAYFETKTQEIYICKNEAEALTYIATPKKKGNSQFLPAQKVQQGDVTGYLALDDTKTYVVTPGGFQLQDSGKTKKSEKVIRRQLAKP